MAKLVPVIKTTCSKGEMIAGLVSGWIKQFGEIPKKESIGVIYAQNCIETGGTINCYNWNIGNVKYIPTNGNPDNDDTEYMMLNGVWEILNGKKVIFSPPDRQTWFRSFPSLEEGAAHHFDFLKNKRYAKCWSAVVNGNPAEFAHLLKVYGYYTAPESDYIKGMNLYFNLFMKSKDYENALNQKTGTWKSITNLFGKFFG